MRISSQRLGPMLDMRSSLKSKLKKLVHGADVPRTSRSVPRPEKRKVSVAQLCQQEKTIHEYLTCKYFTNITNVFKRDPTFASRHPAVYKYLGTSANQAQNSYIVARDVAKFLRRNEPAKALYLVKLAGASGGIAMNHVLKYLLDSGMTQVAFKAAQFARKWGCKSNCYTYGTMLKAHTLKRSRSSDSADDESKARQAKQILELLEKGRSSAAKRDTATRVILSNSALRSLSLLGPIHAMALYNKLPLSEKNHITYTCTVSALGPSQAAFAHQLYTEVMDRAQRKQVRLDRHLVCAFILYYVRVKDYQRAMTILQTHYEIPASVQDLAPASVPSRTPNLGVPAVIEYDLWMRSLLESRHFDKVKSLYQRIPENNDLALVNKYLEALKATADVGLLTQLVPQVEALKPSSSLLASMMSFYLHPSTKVDLDQIELIRAICNRVHGYFPRPCIFVAYTGVYEKAFQTDPPHPRNALKPVQYLSTAMSSIVQNLQDNQDLTPDVIRGLASLESLCTSVFTDARWGRTRFLGIEKLGLLAGQLKRSLQQGHFAPRSLDSFKTSFTTISSTLLKPHYKKSNVSTVQPSSLTQATL